MKWPNFIGGTYVSQSPIADQEELVNWFQERMESRGASAQMALYPTPGMTTLSTATTTGGRAHTYVDGRAFAVIGSTLWEYDDAGTFTSRGSVGLNSSPATISYNGDGGGELFITSGGNGYLFTLATDTLTTISALSGKATMGAAIDGYFLALDGATGTFYASDLLDGTTWQTGVMFAQRIAAPDPWIAMEVKGPYIWLQGPETSEVWYNAGSSPFPFAKHPSGLVPYGTAAPFSVRVCGDSIVWLGASKEGTGFVLRATGFTPEVVGTYPVQFAMSGYGTVSDAHADSYNEAGHSFWVLTFPTADATWVWDLQMGQWHRRGTWNTTRAAFGLWRPRAHAFAFGEHRWLDATSGALYKMSAAVGTDAGGGPIRRMRRAPALVNENEFVYYSALELDLEPGLGLVTGQGSNPKVMFRVSRDGGKTWGPERSCSAGKLGEYGKRVRLERLGAARRLVVEVSVSDPMPYRVMNAYLSLGQPAGEERGTA